MPIIETGHQTIFSGKKKPAVPNKRAYPTAKQRGNSVANFAKEIAMRKAVKHMRSYRG